MNGVQLRLPLNGTTYAIISNLAQKDSLDDGLTNKEYAIKRVKKVTTIILISMEDSFDYTY